MVFAKQIALFYYCTIAKGYYFVLSLYFHKGFDSFFLLPEAIPEAIGDIVELSIIIEAELQFVKYG